MAEQLTLGQINDNVLKPIDRPGSVFWGLMCLLGAALFWGFLNFYYQHLLKFMTKSFSILYLCVIARIYLDFIISNIIAHKINTQL